MQYLCIVDHEFWILYVTNNIFSTVSQAKLRLYIIYLYIYVVKLA
jgi:hypothetical protein